MPVEVEKFDEILFFLDPRLASILPLNLAVELLQMAEKLLQSDTGRAMESSV